ncbi:MAG TPA: hypothetical protein VJ436_05220 [Anaerolineales bacterium]|nr:hypothetical protein [Anaerolineales bacterium]
MSTAEDFQSGPNMDLGGEELTQLRSRLEALFHQGQWQAVLILSTRMLEKWPGLADVTLMNFKARQGVELEQELSRKLAQSQQSGLMNDWQASWQAAQTLAQLSPDNPGYRKTLEQAEQNIVWSSLVSQAEELLKADRWSEAASILAGVPSDLPTAANVRAEIERKKKAAERQLSGHLERAEIAYQAGDLEGGIALLDQALRRSPDDPDLNDRRQRWLGERDWRAQLEEARRTYHLDRLLELLEARPGYPQAGPLRAWAEQEGERRRQTLVAISIYDAEAVQELIAGLPDRHPDLLPLQRWLETESVRREQLRQARERSDYRRVMELLSEVTVAYPGYQEWTDWVARKSDQTFGAHQSDLVSTAAHAPVAPVPTGEAPTQWEPTAGGSQATLMDQLAQPVETTESAMPFRDTQIEAQSPAHLKKDPGESLQMAQEAFAAQDYRAALQHLEEVPQDQPHPKQLRAEARQHWIAQLYEQANAAEANLDWEAATLAWLNLQVLQVDDPQIAQRLEAIPHEINYAQLLSQADSASNARQWKEAIQVAGQASRLFPDRPEPRLLLSSAQAAATKVRRRRLVLLLAGGFGLFSILGIALAWTAVSAGWLPAIFARTATPTSVPPTATQTSAPPSPSPIASNTPAPVLAVSLSPSPSPIKVLTHTPSATLTASPTATLKPLPPTPVPTATKKKEPKPKPPDTDQPPNPTEPPGSTQPSPNR